MNTTIEYNQTDAIAKYNAAIADCREYFGKRFDTVVAEFRKCETPMAMDQFECYMGLAGVSGYPVKAMYNYIWPL